RISKRAYVEPALGVQFDRVNAFFHGLSLHYLQAAAAALFGSGQSPAENASSLLSGVIAHINRTY
ncbi:MAG: hypothetical protein PHS26_07620, partial [Actinomycetota bacterium]|nr:hypothetical protein [Actinomycetota bacterium]